MANPRPSTTALPRRRAVVARLPVVELELFLPAAAEEFAAAARRSRALHRPWVHPPLSADAAAELARGRLGPASYGYLVRAGGDARLAGYIAVSNIVRGAFRSAYLGYYAFAGCEGRGLMSAGLRAVLAQARTTLGLHRLEANIQPGNAASIALVQRLGFRCEGYSPRYLKIGGRWRDHERWAILLE
jgi:ribosomal-protein-alanine N-acetyltransferase